MANNPKGRLSSLMDVQDPDSLLNWHRRGIWRFIGALGLFAMAVTVTNTWSINVVYLLAGAAAATSAASLLLKLTGLATRRWSLMLVPASVIISVGLLEIFAHDASVMLLGLFSLCFLFIGLSHQPRACLWMIPFASYVFVRVLDAPLDETAIRLLVAIVVWVVCAEVPAQLIGEIRHKSQLLETMATRDALTGLLNRVTLDAALASSPANTSVALIDLDRFKNFNDEFGHVSGDRVLREFAQLLLESKREHDSVFRYGGEEFIVVLRGSAPEDAVAMLERVAAAWAAGDSGLTFSAGVTVMGKDAVHTADMRLYQAKKEGRNRIVSGPASGPTTSVVGYDAAPDPTPKTTSTPGRDRP